MTEQTDNALIIKCKARDKSAYGILVERYKRSAYGFAFSYLKNVEDALNISQDAFVRAWKAIDTFETGKQFRPWLFSIIKNLSYNLLAKKKNLREMSLEMAMEESGFDIPDTHDSPLKNLEMDETRQQVWKAVFDLKEEFREVIILKHFQDLSYNEIAVSLDLPMGTVMSRLYYARLELKKKLSFLSGTLHKSLS